jgi:ABC-type antimicrobial peptide transport system permease subunit
MSWQVSFTTLAETFVLAQVAALLAAYWPMRAFHRTDVVEALQTE